MTWDHTYISEACHYSKVKPITLIVLVDETRYGINVKLEILRDASEFKDFQLSMTRVGPGVSLASLWAWAWATPWPWGNQKKKKKFYQNTKESEK